MFTNLPETKQQTRRLPLFFSVICSYWLMVLSLTIVGNILLFNPVLAESKVVQLSAAEHVERLDNGGLLLSKDRLYYPYDLRSPYASLIAPTMIIKRCDCGCIQSFKPIKLVKPEYPPLARTGRVKGYVSVMITIDDDGNVNDAHIFSGHPWLREATLAAVKQSKFAIKNDDSLLREKCGTLTFKFTL